MVWQLSSDGIVLPNGRINQPVDVGESGRVLVYFPQSDYEDTRLRCLVEFSSYQPELQIESPVIAVFECRAKAAIVVAPYVLPGVGFAVVFPYASIVFAGQTYEVYRDIPE